MSTELVDRRKCIEILKARYLDEKEENVKHGLGICIQVLTDHLDVKESNKDVKDVVDELPETAIEIINKYKYHEFTIMFCVIQALYVGFKKGHQECKDILCKHDISENILINDRQYKISQYEMCKVINKHPECINELKRLLEACKYKKLNCYNNHPMSHTMINYATDTDTQLWGISIVIDNEYKSVVFTPCLVNGTSMK